MSKSEQMHAEKLEKLETETRERLNQLDARLEEFRLAAEEIRKSATEIVELKAHAQAEHSAVLEALRSNHTTAAEIQGQIATVYSDLEAKSSESTSILTSVRNIAEEVTLAQGQVATKSGHIEDARQHAELIQTKLDELLNTATQNTQAVETWAAKAQSHHATSENALLEVKAAKTSADSELSLAASARREAEAAAAAAKTLAEKSTTIEQSIAEYESRLKQFEQTYGDQHDRVEKLIQGATSAGLAHFFDMRRQSFVSPQKRWQWVFVGSLTAIVILAITGVWRIYFSHEIPTYDELFRLWLARLPIGGALIWLAVYASRESALAKRLEEEYGFKSAIASCFEGFQKRMAEVGNDVPPGSALAKLCENTLQTIANPPGRIYDKHKLTVSPTDELARLARAAAEAAKVTKPI